MKAILAAQLMVFFLIGTQIWHHQIQCARVQAASEILLSLPLSALTETEI